MKSSLRESMIMANTSLKSLIHLSFVWYGGWNTLRVLNSYTGTEYLIWNIKFIQYTTSSGFKKSSSKCSSSNNVMENKFWTRYHIETCRNILVWHPLKLCIELTSTYCRAAHPQRRRTFSKYQTLEVKGSSTPSPIAPTLKGHWTFFWPNKDISNI